MTDQKCGLGYACDVNPHACVIRPDDHAAEVALEDEHGPLVWYDGCGSHRIAISQRFARAMGVDDTLTPD